MAKYRTTQAMVATIRPEILPACTRLTMDNYPVTNDKQIFYMVVFQ